MENPNEREYDYPQQLLANELLGMNIYLNAEADFIQFGPLPCFCVL